MVAPHLRTGSRGERAAEDFLRRKGYSVVARNWRAGKPSLAGKAEAAARKIFQKSTHTRRESNLELDLVCLHGDMLVFVEVKTRSKGGMQRPDQALTAAKRTRLIRAAEHYLSQTGKWQYPCRFDLVAVQQHGDTYTVTHYEHAFDISESVGSSHTAWQPW